MPHIDKKVISRYFRTECKRQLKLSLYPHTMRFRQEREELDMPPKQNPRPGLSHITAAGDEWQIEKLQDLSRTFGEDAIIGEPIEDGEYKPLNLKDALGRATSYKFIVESVFDITPSFERELEIESYKGDYGLEYATLRPDIIEVLPSRNATKEGTFSKCVTPSGVELPIPDNDKRLQLRVIDIKLTSEPSPSYFAEVAYYILALSSWLKDNNLDNKFIAVPDGAIWHGTHDASCLSIKYNDLIAHGIKKPRPSDLLDALEDDLEMLPFSVFAFRIKRFFRSELKEALKTDYQDLSLHVDNLCKSCDYLGYPWRNSEGDLTCHPNHCMPIARASGHLSRVAFISRGARESLETQGVMDVRNLAQRSFSDPVFNMHQELCATRRVVANRAASLETEQSLIPDDIGTTAMMPRWADLRIFLSIDFDIGSAITFAFGLKAFWLEPRDFNDKQNTQRERRMWEPVPLIVDQRSVQAELRELLALLDNINAILVEAHDANPATTVQFYIWDNLQYDHLARIIGRHLESILQRRNIVYLAWLFPPEGFLSNPELICRRSTITIVRDVVRSLLVIPIPHYYSLLETARNYHAEGLPEGIARFNIHPLFEDALSDQIPSERAHEIWSHSTAEGHYWRTQMDILSETVTKKLRALETVTKRLENDLGRSLIQHAPSIESIGPPQRQAGVSLDGQLWYTFAKLDEAMKELGIHKIRAMPPYEREARFRSARLTCRLTDMEEERELCRIFPEASPDRLQDYRVYVLDPQSLQVRAREGDFSFALSREDQPGFLDRTLISVSGNAYEGLGYRTLMERITSVAIVSIDRESGLIVLKPNERYRGILYDLEGEGIIDLRNDLILDPTYNDFFTGKLLNCLKSKGIGNPRIANSNPLVRRNDSGIPLTNEETIRPRTNKHTPPADLLWDALMMHNTHIERNLEPVKQELSECGVRLNPRQWDAWLAALSCRLQLVWGPPGTGKSRTARAIVLGAALEAYANKRGLHILISAITYIAIDNILENVVEDIKLIIPDSEYSVNRLRSNAQPSPLKENLRIIDVGMGATDSSDRMHQMMADLDNPKKITIVSATPSQVYNLVTAKSSGRAAQHEIFDLILIDEASQMDVAHSILTISSLANEGTVILAGDPKQLPPIHEAKPPLGLESLVGSIYDFCVNVHNVESIMLDVNYRSNSVIVDFSKNAGYEGDLRSFSPDLQLNLISSLPTAKPEGWPEELYWTPEWAEMLDPEKPAVCFVYPEGVSSQRNQFESDAVSALAFLLHGKVSNQLKFEKDPETDHYRPDSSTLYSDQEFWEKGIGIVSPHRAQQGLIIDRLQHVFAGIGLESSELQSAIRGAVDTVERFQGQQRDVIIASFAMGDPDAIRDEAEFLMSLNRFNVMASRARAKLIVLISQQLVDHLSDDIDVLRDSSLLKSYVESYCEDYRDMTLGFIGSEGLVIRDGSFKYKNFPRADRPARRP